ncbi:prepilin-type N-terminal cleavage/methylation domain-containing protein [Candidatus Sumerlaeota bacterium]|nr:prepilin-type N-terminal cleavage/methylation domain-containing protein [Candidatus Sumerlaeota bacterium]
MKKKAFTLIELLIVVAIIAILAAIAVPNFLEAQVRSKVSRVKSDIRSVITALEAYRVDTNKYPPCMSIIEPTVNPADIISGGGSSPVNPPILRLIPLTSPIAYITTIPQDAFNIKYTGWGPPPVGTVIYYWGSDYLDLMIDASPPTHATIFAETPENLWVKDNFVLLSFSPDQDFDVVDGGWPSTIQLYDPTNGTVSDGDIVRSRVVNWK